MQRRLTAFHTKPRKPLKRTPFKSKGRIPTKKRVAVAKHAKKRRSRSELAKAKDKLWELCKQITRKRYGNQCYTCLARDLEGSNWHTGHFLTDSVCSTELSYDLKNLRPQCYSCNIHKSGNWPAFESRLLNDHGLEYIQELKERNRQTTGLQYDRLWYLAKIEEYQKILTELSTSRDHLL